MSRPSKLHIPLRLARFAERRALAGLGRARQRTAALERARQDLERALDDARFAVGRALDSAVSAEELHAHGHHTRALRQRSQDVSTELAEARGQEEEARRALIDERVRVRALESALQRRARRQRRRARRRETSALDEAVRAVSALTRGDDAA